MTEKLLGLFPENPFISAGSCQRVGGPLGSVTIPRHHPCSRSSSSIPYPIGVFNLDLYGRLVKSHPEPHSLRFLP